MQRRSRALVASGVLLLGTAGCGGDGGPGAASPTPTAAATAAAGADATLGATPGTSVASPRATALPAVGDPLSLPALMREEFPPSRLRQVSVEARTDAYVRSRVTYGAGEVTVSGVLLRPTGSGPFPGIVLNHGYIEPSRYRPGQGLAREQDRLARAGFAVLHTDYRGHAGSDGPVGAFDMESRLGYTRDAIHAVLALEREPYVDPDRMAMLGRSMGGAVTLNALVAYPNLVEAAVVYASVSSRFDENVEHFTQPNRPGASKRMYETYGTPEEAPEFYDGLSARTYFDRVSDPLLMHHGRRDGTCPFRWATETQQALVAAGADSTLLDYDEDHTFYGAWPESMNRTIRFLREHLD